MSNRPPIPDESPTNGSRPSPDDTTLVIEEPRFSLVPEWVIDAQIPDSSFRLYSLLLRYGGSSGSRMPSRTTLARRLHRSVDAVDRAMRELVNTGIVRVEHRRQGQQNLTNRYHVRTSTPLPSPEGEDGRVPAATSVAHSVSAGSGRGSAATARGAGAARTCTAPTDRGSAATPGRTLAATPGRVRAVRVAAAVRPDRDLPTETPPPSGRHGAVVTGDAEVEAVMLADCGVVDIALLVFRCETARRALGLSTTRWSAHCLSAALQLAVRGRGWPAASAVAALLAVAADPATRSPMRVAEAGPWWDHTPPAAVGSRDASELMRLEERLAEVGGRRPVLQARARQELAAEGLPLTRSTVVHRACQILDRTEGES